MKPEREPKLSPRMQGAVERLKALLLEHYPAATFRVTRDPEEYHSVDLFVTVDLDDLWEVSDLVREPLWDLEIRQHIPIHVIPLHTPARVRAILEEQRRERLSPPPIPADLLEPLNLREG